MFPTGTQFNYTLNGNPLPPPMIQDLPDTAGNVIPAKSQFQLIWNGLDSGTITALQSVAGQQVPLVCTEPSSGSFFTVTVVPRLPLLSAEIIGGIGLDAVGTDIVGTGSYYALGTNGVTMSGGIGMDALGLLALGTATFTITTTVKTTLLQLTSQADASIATPAIFAYFY